MKRDGSMVINKSNFTKLKTKDRVSIQCIGSMHGSPKMRSSRRAFSGFVSGVSDYGFTVIFDKNVGGHSSIIGSSASGKSGHCWGIFISEMGSYIIKKGDKNKIGW